ncbi:MAG: transglycosylase [Deltaproteobacteria bacterium]|nr:transglycosylase [Deltaproteobacteria bacterium]
MTKPFAARNRKKSRAFHAGIFSLPIPLLVLFLLLSSCVKAPPPPPDVPPRVEKIPPLAPVDWSEVAGWNDRSQDFLAPFQVFRNSCAALKTRSPWREVCGRAEELTAESQEQARRFFESFFRPHQVRNEDGNIEGLMTGYYVPDLVGRRHPTARFRHPLYRVPDDLLTIDLGEFRKDLQGLRLRGRLDGKKIIPYWVRSQIDGPQKPLLGQELFWVEDPVDLFFLHIQGSGRILLENGATVMVGYAEQNGHAYRSIGKLLIDSKEMTREQMSMQNIRAWARRNPDKTLQLLGENPRYIFFRELPPRFQTPPGSLGIPLTPRLSLAVDPSVIPLGAPVMVATLWPGHGGPLNKLMLAQDTGGAIKGPVRGDFFWGMGDAAGQLAGRMKEKCRFWVLLPREG